MRIQTLLGPTMMLAAIISSGCIGVESPLAGSTANRAVSLELGWTQPEHLDAPINSAFRELGGSFSRDGLSMYFESDRPGGQGGVDIWVAHRDCRTCPWGDPVNLGPTINTPTGDSQPAFSADGRMMVFSRGNSPGGFGGEDLWLSRRDDPNDDLGWGAPVNLGPLVNTTSNDQNPHLYVRGVGEGDADLVFQRNNGRFFQVRLTRDGDVIGPAVDLVEINDLPPTADDLRLDGSEALFFQRGGGLGGSDLWVSVRPNANSAWSAPKNLGNLINTPGADLTPAYSWDGRTLVFAAGQNARPTLGLQDLWVVHRKP